jgi:hypothetical protein
MQNQKLQSNKWTVYLLFICLSLMAYEFIVNVKYTSHLNVYVFILAEILIICIVLLLMGSKNKKKINSIEHIL